MPGEELGAKLTPEEDAAMRRLNYFSEIGCDLAEPVAGVLDSIRKRDRRDEIRPPRDEVVIGDGPTDPAPTAP